jgi:hypothetical protein
MTVEELIQKLEDFYFMMHARVELDSTPAYFESHLARLHGMQTIIATAYIVAGYPQDLRRLGEPS